MAEVCPDCGRSYAQTYAAWQCSDTTCGMSPDWNEDGERHDDCINECLYASRNRYREALAAARAVIAAADDMPEFIDQTIRPDDDGFAVVAIYHARREEFERVMGEKGRMAEQPATAETAYYLVPRVGQSTGNLRDLLGGPDTSEQTATGDTRSK